MCKCTIFLRDYVAEHKVVSVDEQLFGIDFLAVSTVEP